MNLFDCNIPSVHIQLFRDVWNELTVYCNQKDSYSKNDEPNVPSFQWCSLSTIKILQAYPTGVSKPVLLTELESKWRSCIRSGEHSGRLKQVINNGQLSLDEIIIGKLNKIDDFRCLLTDETDGTSIEMIMHRQYADLTAFIRFSLNIEISDNRKCSFIACRLLPSSPILLPTPLGHFVIDVMTEKDNHIYLKLLLPISMEFLSYFEPFFPNASLGHHDNKYANNSNNDNANDRLLSLDKLTNPNNILVILATIDNIGDIHPHPSRLSSQYLIVRLTITVGNKKKYLFLILYDDQTRFALLWKKGITLALFRPYVDLNSSETMFGTEASNSVIGNLGAVVEYRPVPELADPDIISESVPVHLMYGPLSAICIIINADKNHENLDPNNNYINYKDSNKNADNDKCNMISNYIDKSDYAYNNIDNSNHDNYHHNSNNIDNNNTSVNDDKCNDLANDDSSTTTMNKISPTEGIMVRILKVKWTERNHEGERGNEEPSTSSKEPSTPSKEPSTSSKEPSASSALMLWASRVDLPHMMSQTNNCSVGGIRSSVENKKKDNHNTSTTIPHHNLGAPIKITIPLNPSLTPSFLNLLKSIENKHILYISGLIWDNNTTDKTSHHMDCDSTNNINENNYNNDNSNSNIDDISIDSFTTNPENTSSSNFNNGSPLLQPPLELFNISLLKALTCSPSLLPI